MNTIFTQTVKRYFLSSVITFVSTFLTVLAMNVGNLSPQAFSFAAVSGMLLVALRAGTKAVMEAVVGGHADLPAIGQQAVIPASSMPIVIVPPQQ